MHLCGMVQCFTRAEIQNHLRNLIGVFCYANKQKNLGLEMDFFKI